MIKDWVATSRIGGGMNGVDMFFSNLRLLLHPALGITGVTDASQNLEYQLSRINGGICGSTPFEPLVIMIATTRLSKLHQHLR